MDNKGGADTAATSESSPSGGAAVLVDEKKGKGPAAAHKPDEDFYNKLIDEETTAYEALRAKVVELSAIIRERSGGREEFIQQRDSMREKLNDLNQRIVQLEDEAQRLRDKAAERLKKGQSLRSEAQQLQRDVGFRNGAEIDARIKELERDLMISSLNVREEKQLIGEIQRLKRSKPQLLRILELENDAHQLESEPSRDITTRTNQIREELRNLRTNRIELQEKLRDLIQRREDTMSPLREFVDQREELRRQMLEHDTKRSMLRSEYMTKLQDFRVYQANVRHERVDQERIERQRSQLAAQKEALTQKIESVGDVPMNARIMLYQQLITYLQEAMKQYADAVAGQEEGNAVKLTDQDDVSQPDGIPDNCTILAPKALRPSMVQHKSKKKGAKPKSTTRAVTKNIHHTMETLRQFYSVGLDTYPKTVDDCPPVIEWLEQQLNKSRESEAASRQTAEARKAELLSQLKDLELKEKEFDQKYPKRKFLSKPTELR